MKNRVWVNGNEYIFPNEFDAHGFATECAMLGWEVIVPDDVIEDQ